VLQGLVPPLEIVTAQHHDEDIVLQNHGSKPKDLVSAVSGKAAASTQVSG